MLWQKSMQTFPEEQHEILLQQQFPKIQYIVHQWSLKIQIFYLLPDGSKKSQTLNHTFSHDSAVGNAIKLKANMITKPYHTSESTYIWEI